MLSRTPETVRQNESLRLFLSGICSKWKKTKTNKFAIAVVLVVEETRILLLHHCCRHRHRGGGGVD